MLISLWPLVEMSTKTHFNIQCPPPPHSYGPVLVYLFNSHKRYLIHACIIWSEELLLRTYYYIAHSCNYAVPPNSDLCMLCIYVRLARLSSCICALWFCGGLRGSDFLTQDRFFKNSWIMFRGSLDTTSLHILKIELKRSLFSTEIAISANLQLCLGHFTCSKLIFYGRIGNYHTNKIIFIISGEHYIKKLGF